MTSPASPTLPPNRAAHWLLFPEVPTSQELEALVVSRELGVTWVDERTLGWQPGVLLQGPMTQEELASSVGLPEWARSVYAVDTPRERGAPIPAELQLPGAVLGAFPEGEPTGVERDTLETIEAIARRLGGAVLTETGQIVVPEPRIDLVLFTSTWIAEPDLIRVLDPIVQMRSDGGPALPPDVEVEGYGLVADLPLGAVLSVTASPADLTPIALTGYGWATGSVYVYEFRHYPASQFSFSGRTRLPLSPADAEALVDGEAAALVEEAAAAVLDAAGGQRHAHLSDDDGFLVVLD
ncbi:MAG TPA: hypothetical protein VK098_00580 [Beutenbergiaceae bacterium]|nr:hypothetical protein [Beutenbergiaceae bacterium]